jgi:hypothetical protein
MSSTTPEGKVKAKLAAMLKANKVWYFFPANNGFGKAGIPDVILCWYGRFIGVEVKSARGKPTDLQLHVGAQIQDAGGKWFLVRSESDIAQLETVLINIRDNYHAGS